MKKVCLTAILFCCLFPIVSYGQDESEFFKHVENGNYEKASLLMEGALKSAPNSPKYLFLAGVLDVFSHQPEKGLEKLEKARSVSSTVGKYEFDYWLGIAYHFNDQYENAISAWQNYLRKCPADYKGRKEEVKSLIEEAKKGMEFDEIHTMFLVENMGEGINTKFSEHSAVYAENESSLYYTSTHPEEITADGFYIGVSEDIRVADLSVTGVPESSEEIDGKVNSRHNEGIITLFDNNRKMLVFKTNGNGDFYYSERMGDFWSKEKPLKGINSIHAESHATFSADGKTIIFSSNRNSNSGKFDLFISKKEGEKWSKPELINGVNNSYYDEDFPFLSADGSKLYFSSNRKGGLGGYDVYVSNFNKTTKKWGKPVNLGKPVNSPQDDVFFTFNELTGEGFLASNRYGGFGQSDIYKVAINKEILLKGYVFHDSAPEEKRNNLFIRFTGLDTASEFIAKVDQNGYYQLPITLGEKFTCRILDQTAENEFLLLKEEVIEIKSPDHKSTVIRDIYLTESIEGFSSAKMVE